MQGVRCSVLGAGYEVQCLGCMICGAVFGVQGVRCSVWGAGFFTVGPALHMLHMLQLSMHLHLHLHP